MWRKRIDLNELKERIIKDVDKARERTMNRAVKLLAAKPRSIGELRERLLEKVWTNAEIVNLVLEKLKEYGYLDDQKYAVDLALSKLRQKPQGKRRLQQAMSQKKLDRETLDSAIASAFEKMPEIELINRAIEKRLRIKGRPESRDDTKKFYDYLIRQGFGFDLIRDKMTEVAKFHDE
ncbi:MAG: regulatory protein RecX [Acidobacteriota bacterium]